MYNDYSAFSRLTITINLFNWDIVNEETSLFKKQSIEYLVAKLAQKMG